MIDEGDAWDEDNPSYRLEKGDRLFINDDERFLFDKNNDYCYIGYRLGSFDGYAYAYKQAADRLVESLKNYPIPFNNYLTPPIVYLYRHYLELHLKSLVYGNKPPDQPNHRLYELWKKLKRKLPDTCGASVIEVVEECIMEFDDVDRESDAFRFHIGKGKKSLLNTPYLLDVNYINLLHLKDKMSGIHDFLLESDLLLMEDSNQASTANPTTNFE